MAMLPYLMWTYEVDFGHITTSQIPKWWMPTGTPRRSACIVKATTCWWKQYPTMTTYTGKQILPNRLHQNTSSSGRWQIHDRLHVHLWRPQFVYKNQTDCGNIYNMAETLVQKFNTQGTLLDSQMVMSQLTTITQLTEQVSTLQTESTLNSTAWKKAFGQCTP